MPRPSKINRAAAQRVIEATARGATREAAAAHGPVARSTLYEWIRQGRLNSESAAGRFVAALDDADDQAELACIDAWRDAFPKDWRAVAAFMERRWPQRWGRHETLAVEAGVRISDEERATHLIEDLVRWRREQGIEDELENTVRVLPPDDSLREWDRRGQSLRPHPNGNGS